MLKIFISHTFSENDQKLSTTFDQYLFDNKMKGYLAENEPEYILLINEKIRQKINDSDCLVAILTNDSSKSASVHQEIGFAIGKDVPVVLFADERIEETIKNKGVLTYGKEIEFFNETNFKLQSQKIIKAIQKYKRKRRSNIYKPMKEFLLKRKLSDPEMIDFCQNYQTERLQSKIDKTFIPNGIPFLLFSAYPHNFIKYDMYDKAQEFIEKCRYIDIRNHKILFYDGIEEIEMNSLSYYSSEHDSKNKTNRVYEYLTFQKNGFIEQGFSDNLIYTQLNKNSSGPSLHSTWITGAFWAFLKFSKLYYEEIGGIEKFDVVLSIRNSKNLSLLGYRQHFSNDEWPHNFITSPITRQTNIKTTIESLVLDEMNDKFIASNVYQVSREIAQAYGLKWPLCYDSDKRFDWDHMNSYNQRRIVYI